MAEMKAADKQGDDDCKSDKEAGTNEKRAGVDMCQQRRRGRKRKIKDCDSTKGTKRKGEKKRKAETLVIICVALGLHAEVGRNVLKFLQP